MESHRPMGLDTGAGALLVAQSDAPGAACAAEIETMRTACEAAGSPDVFVTDDADEGEQFVQARRMVIPSVELLGELMMEDVGVPVPRLPDLVDAVARIADRHDLLIPVIAHAGDGRTKRHALPDQLGDDVMALTRRVKDALDPHGILNPGAILQP